MKKKSRNSFNAKVVLETLKARIKIEELGSKDKLHLTQINSWKREALENMASVFGTDKSEVQANN